MTDNGWAPRGSRYYSIVFSLLVAASVVAFFVPDGATWAIAAVGVLTGGFVFDAVLDWLKHRKVKHGGTD